MKKEGMRKKERNRGKGESKVRKKEQRLTLYYIRKGERDRNRV